MYSFGRTENLVSVIWRLLVRLALVGLVAYGCYRLRSIITTLFVAAIIAYVLNPPVEWLCHCHPFVKIHSTVTCWASLLGEKYRRIFYRKRVTSAGRVRLQRHVLRIYASLYVFVLFLLALWYGGKLVVSPFAAEFQKATSLQSRQVMAAKIKKRLTDYDKNAPPWARSDKLLERLRGAEFAGVTQKIAAEAGMRLLEGAKSIVEVVLLPVLAFYFLIDGRKLKHEFISLVPRGRLHETVRMVNEFNRIMRSFVLGQVILCVLAGVVVGVGLAALSVPYPFVLGVMAGITRAIPIIGPIVGGIPIILLTLATKGVPTAVAVLGFFTFLHFAESKFIMPLIIGDRLELHPVVIIVVLIVGGEIGSILIGGSLGSLLGMFFAAPVAAILRVMVRRYWLRLRPSSQRLPARSLIRFAPEVSSSRLPESID